MSPNINTITVVGNLVDDPKLKVLNDGTAVANCTIAASKRVRNAATNEWTDELDGYFDSPHLA